MSHGKPRDWLKNIEMFKRRNQTFNLLFNILFLPVFLPFRSQTTQWFPKTNSEPLYMLHTCFSVLQIQTHIEILGKMYYISNENTVLQHKPMHAYSEMRLVYFNDSYALVKGKGVPCRMLTASCDWLWGVVLILISRLLEPELSDLWLACA